MRADPSRFYARTRPNGDCLEWTGRLDKHGYGVVGLTYGKKARSHRKAWMLAYGPIPDGLWVLHHCDNRKCVRLEHLYLGTVFDNNRDMWARSGRTRALKVRRKTYTVGSQHPMAKLNEQQVVEIRMRLATGAAQCALADMYGVSPTTIQHIRKRRTWTHV